MDEEDTFCVLQVLAADGRKQEDKQVKKGKNLHREWCLGAGPQCTGWEGKKPCKGSDSDSVLQATVSQGRTLSSDRSQRQPRHPNGAR